MKRTLFTVLVAFLFGALLFPAAATSAPNKVDLCHARGSGTYQLINISNEAVGQHIAEHDDGLPGGPVPGVSGATFRGDCTVRCPYNYAVIISGVCDAATSAPNKVDLCHARGSGTYQLINISNEAVGQHIAEHDDGLPGGPVPGVSGATFRGDCTVRCPYNYAVIISGVCDAATAAGRSSNHRPTRAYGWGAANVTTVRAGGSDVAAPLTAAGSDSVLGYVSAGLIALVAVAGPPSWRRRRPAMH